jgi:hypothetical protein
MVEIVIDRSLIFFQVRDQLGTLNLRESELLQVSEYGAGTLSRICLDLLDEYLSN